jgi:hypothetical protein
MTADFLQSHRHLDPSIDGQLQGILDALTDMAGINNLAADFLSKR